MRAENFLFTRSQRQDFTAFVRPARMTNQDVSTIGGIFNYVTDISRLTSDFPSLYSFGLGDYWWVLRHYDSGRTHAGRAIGVIEGIAVPQDDAVELAGTLAALVENQARALNISAGISDIETQPNERGVEAELSPRRVRRERLPFVEQFAERRADDRLFLPFTPTGRDLLITALANAPSLAPTGFAFGTNSDVLAQLEFASIDVVSFFNTDQPAFRSRTTHRVTAIIDGYTPESAAEPAVDPSMALRGGHRDERSLRVRADDAPPAANVDEDDETLVSGVSMRVQRRAPAPRVPDADETDDGSTVLTMRELRDQMRAEEAAAQAESEREEAHGFDPIRWLVRLVSSLVKPK